jgi:hypothetical protein
VHRATQPRKLSTRSSRHFIALAWLLLVAQLFSQLHGLEHLEDGDHDEHSTEICQLCILSASLDHGSIDSVVISGVRFQAARLPNVGCTKSTSRLLTAYQGRAPPEPSSIA